MLIEVLISASLLSPADTLAPAVAVANKEDRAVTGMVSGLSSKDLQRQGINNPKELAAIIPGLYIPDYGASLTSTIYVRGMGSRMENPVTGLSGTVSASKLDFSLNFGESPTRFNGKRSSN